MFLSVLFYQGKGQVFWFFVDKVASFNQDFGLGKDIILNDSDGNEGAIITFKDDAVRHVEVEESYESSVLEVEVDFLKYCFFSHFIIFLTERFISISLVSVQVRDFFVQLNALTCNQQGSRGPKLFIFELFLT